ncbi:MAG: hypothetical protein NTV94_11240 [Planctomycetota bacterium]|nr:hypothetical protein [Planctomycetota bacterium]
MKSHYLDRITDKMTPKQIALIWIAWGQEFATSLEFAHHLATNPPVRTMCEQVDAGVMARNAKLGPGSPREDAWITKREALFLVNLAQQANNAILMSQSDFWDPWALAIIRLHQHRLGVDPESCDSGFRFADPVSCLERLWSAAHGILTAKTVVEEQYFDGQPILARDAAALLTERIDAVKLTLHVVRELEQTTAMSGAVTEKRTHPGSSLNANAAAQRFITEWVQIAKSRTCTALGESSMANVIDAAKLDAAIKDARQRKGQ